MMERWAAIRAQNESGFTMVELMVTVAILGVLTSISIPIYLTQKKTSIDETVEADLRTAAMWVETWTNQNRKSQVPVLTLQNTDGTGVTKPAATGTVVGFTGPLTQIKVSNGTKVEISPGAWGSADDLTATPGTFTIKGTNSKGKLANSSNGIQYSSSTGGLK